MNDRQFTILCSLITFILSLFSSLLIKAYDNITGSMDNMSFYTGKNGILEYDYKEGKGHIVNNVFVSQGPNSISSDSVIFDVNNNYIFFKDNVTVTYVPE